MRVNRTKPPSPRRGGVGGGVTPPALNIVAGQRVTAEKLEAAKRLRREMTSEERRLWQALRGNRLHGLHFRRQQVIRGFIVDFYCHQRGLVVEVDGPQHRGEAAYDAERDRVLAALGLKIHRVANQEVKEDLPRVLQRIAQAALSGARQLGARP
ncbi:MAG: DUF559 domain-containing protein [Dehalococcoidia bacterium]